MTLVSNILLNLNLRIMMDGSFDCIFTLYHMSLIFVLINNYLLNGESAYTLYLKSIHLLLFSFMRHKLIKLGPTSIYI